jgi:LysM repeat protein
MGFGVPRLFVGAIAMAVSNVGAQEGTPRAGDTVSPYTVKPGDTLQKVTARFLGDASLWPENHRLNPQVKDPSRLRVGATLRVITSRVPAARQAQVIAVSRRVEEKPVTSEWRPTREGNLLREKEGLRTGRASSSTLAFDDGSRLDLGEDSLVFLREATTTVSGLKKQSLEILDGQADLKSRETRNKRRSDIRVLVGETVLRPIAGASGHGSARARRESEGGAQVMVFGGSSQVEAQGVTVPVPEGMGTRVPKGAAPARPERLLPSPRGLEPPDGARLSFGNPVLSWNPVKSAAAYTVEICTDVECRSLSLRATALATPRFEVPALERGMYRWRVLAQSASGLDGYTSEPTSLEILDDRLDLEAPVTSLRIDGRSREAALPGAGPEGVDAAVSIHPAGRAFVEAQDDVSGVSRLIVRLGAREEQVAPGPGPILVSLDGEASRLIEFRAIDARGRESRTRRVLIHADSTVPRAAEVHGEPGRSVWLER